MSRFNEIVPASVRQVQALSDQPTMSPTELKAVFDAGSETIVEEYNKQARTLNTLEPVGMISAFAGNEAPTGWLMCDGSLVDISTYSELYSVIGTQYNLETDSDATKFRVPNLVGRVVAGLNANDTNFASLGKTGGSADAIAVSHTHSFTTGSAGGHRHYLDGVKYGTDYCSSGGRSGVGAHSSANTTIYTNTTGAHTHSGTTSSSGSSGTGKNLQPYIVLNYIIRT